MGTVGQPNPELEVLQKYLPQAGKGMGPVERDRADHRAACSDHGLTRTAPLDCARLGAGGRREGTSARPFFWVVLLMACLGCATRSTKPAPVSLTPEGVGTISLTIEIHGLQSDLGSVAVALFDSAESFERRTDAIASQTLAPRDGYATWNVADLPAGTYAVAVYHDLDDNGELDRTTLGPPAEPYGFSNDARRTFGPPGFDSAAIELPPGRHTIRIRVR